MDWTPQVAMAIAAWVYAALAYRDLARVESEIRFEVDLLTREPLPRTPPGEPRREGPYR